MGGGSIHINTVHRILVELRAGEDQRDHDRKTRKDRDTVLPHVFAELYFLLLCRKSPQNPFGANRAHSMLVEACVLQKV